MALPSVHTVSSYGMYLEVSPASEVDYDEYPFVDDDTGKGFISSAVIVSNDGPASVNFAFRSNLSGVILGGTIHKGETLTFDRRYEDRIFVKQLAAGVPIAMRIWAW